ncbi:MAG: GNAT family N-acetyltransferase [Armatimonadetes bacterium]|nr:GNAT family N-acetyltransferase [Armatimonadota bacterium]
MREAFARWFEGCLGASLDLARDDAVPVIACERDAPPLWAVNMGGRTLVTVRPDWLDAVRTVVERLTFEELFSLFGAVELSRVTLREGWGVWGPAWYYAADAAAFLGRADARVARLSGEEVGQIDHDLFWHCPPDPQGVFFGVYEAGRLAALAEVHRNEGEAWEIGVDVAPEAKGSGLGRAVVGTAGRFILEHRRLVMATTAPWNVPSARTMRSLGMRHVLSDLRALPGPFQVPPQMLGSPLPGAELRQYYPTWAMNRDIRPRDG